MRSFVGFIFLSYVLAISILLRSVSVYWLALSYGLAQSLAIWKIIVIVVALLGTIPLFMLMVGMFTSFATRWIAFFCAIALMFGSVLLVCHPVSDWP